MHIDQEFHSLCPPLQPDEFERLEADIRNNGCRDPLVVWRGHDLLLDGHHRLTICRKHQIKFRTSAIDLDGRDEAKIWIIHNQLARRNLTPYQRVEMVLKLEPLYVAQGKANQSHGQTAPGRTLPQNSAEAFAPGETRQKLARAAGISHNTLTKAKIIAEQAPEEVKGKLRSGETTIHAEYLRLTREQKEQDRNARRTDNQAKVAAAPNVDLIAQGAKFATIVCDPPWDWGDEGDGDQLGRARPTYATMPFDDLLRLPVATLTDDDCHLYLWITNRSLPKGFSLLEAWGFRYVTALTWCKPSFGLGNYFRGATEHVLFGVKGSQPLKRKDVGTWFAAPREPKGHSSKPAEFYDLVESCSPGPYLELFARGERPNWSSWGAESHDE